MLVKIRTSKSDAVEEWIMKEMGSYEDSQKDKNHPVALLKKFGGVLSLSEDQAVSLLNSAEYHSTAWKDDEIDGGKKTILVISRYAKKLSESINKSKRKQAI